MIVISPTFVVSRLIARTSLLLVFLFLRAQSQQEKEFKLTAHADLVLLDVSVREAKGGYVSGLKKENFQIYENGKLQVISQFGSEDTPITVGLVLDDSRSMKPKRAEVVTSALGFIDASNPHDEMFVTHFNDRVRRGLPPETPFTDDIRLLRRALWNSPSEGMTALYDGILDALNQLESGKQEKKCLIVITDGGDNASSHHLKEVLEAVQSTRAIVYMVGLYDSDDPDRNPGVIRRLASISGGIAYLPQDISELEGICRSIAKDIRNRYSIGYVPVRVDNKSSLRAMKVSVTGAGDRKFVIHARTSYLLPEIR